MTPQLACSTVASDAQFAVRVSALGSGRRVDISFRVARRCRADRVRLPLDITATRVMENGFQSWSAVRVCEPSDVRPERRSAPRWFRRQMFADGDAAGFDISGDTFLVHDGGTIGFLSAWGEFGRVKVEGSGSLEAQWLLDDIVLQPHETYLLDPLWIGAGDPGDTYDEYTTWAGLEMGARSPLEVPRAWCSWYHYFGDVTPNDIRENLTLAVQHDITVVQIDDGWQKEIGEWTTVNEVWSVPMEQMATEITDAGATAGIWTAPFLAIDGGSIAREHPEWLVRNGDGLPTTALFHAGWGGKIFALDTTHPDVLAHIERTFRTLRDQGFDYFKIDFLHAAAAVGRRHSESSTRAQALRSGLEAVRAGIGDDAYLVGCGCPLLSAVGVVDAMRVSMDVAPFWEPRLFFPGYEDVTVAARNAVGPSLLRAPLHRRWFTLDPDCVLLRQVDTELTSEERKVVADGAIAASGFVVLSDRLSQYGAAEWKEAARLFETGQQGSRATRHLEDPLCEDLVITWDGGRATVNWHRVTSMVSTQQN